MAKATITTRPVASRYEGPDEKIIEYTFPGGAGGLISFQVMADGSLTVDLSRHDPHIKIRVGKPDQA